MVRHLHFVQSLEPLQGGGLGGAALGLHLSLRANGSPSYLVATRAPDFAPEWPGVEQLPRKGPAKAYYGQNLPAVARRVVQAADVVHGHGFYVGTNAVLGRETRRQGKPLVYHPHGFFDPWILRRSRWKKRLAGWFFEHANFRSVHLWRALTSKEGDQIRAAGHRNGEIIVLPNGIDLEDCLNPAPLDSALPHAERRAPQRILLLSRLHPKKGLDLMVEAWSRLADQFPEWEVVLVGPDEDGYQAVVETQIREVGVEERCRVLPPVRGSVKHSVLASADLFALPSYSEGFPVAVVEAAAHGKPVVMTNECNFPELGAVGGAWIGVPTADSVTEILRTALSADESERRQRGEAGHRLIAERYTWTALARQLEEAVATLR